MTTSRFKFALKWAIGHFVVSGLVVSVAAYIIFFLWYPSPWRQMLGVAPIFALVVVVDMVCGPLLTMVLMTPTKSKRERILDLTLIAIVQLAALGYGLFSVASARPVALVFEVDRFVVVTANEVQMDLLNQAPKALQSLSWTGIKMIGLRDRESVSSEEFLRSVALSIEGITQPMRPNWWQLYDDSVKEEVQKKAKSLTSLIEMRPAQADQIRRLVAKAGRKPEELNYLPLTSSKETRWIALIDIEGEIVGNAPVDGF